MSLLIDTVADLVPGAQQPGATMTYVDGLGYRSLRADGLDVRALGAVGDGETDDTAAIQRTIDAASAIGAAVAISTAVFGIKPAESGDLIIFDVPAGTTIHGNGYGSCLRILDDAGDYGAIFGTTNNTVTDLAFGNFRIDQNPTGNTSASVDIHGAGTGQKAIAFFNVGNIAIDRMFFEPCCGVTTISVAATTAITEPFAAVRFCRFVFVKAPTAMDPQGDGHPYYDNSCIYLETANQIVTGNSFHTTLDQDAFGCIEIHGGRATVTGNIADGFETLVNIVTRANVESYPDTDPNQTVVTGNTLTNGKKGITLWPITGRTLREVVVFDNLIHIANAQRGTVDRWHNNDVYVGIGVIYSEGGSLDGGVDGLTITDNRVLFEAENRLYSASHQVLTGGIFLVPHGVGGMRNVTVTNNDVINAPQAGIALWSRSSGTVVELVEIAENRLIDCGRNNAGNSAYRSGIFVATQSGGAMKQVDIDRNKIIDTATGGTPNGFRGVYTIVDSATGLRIGRNPTFCYGSGSLLTTDAHPENVVRIMGRDRGDANVTLVAGVDSEVQRFATTLTTNRTVTLSTTNAQAGDRFRIVRTGGGSFTLAVGSLKTIPSATAAFVDVMYDGLAWVLTGYGALS